MSSIVGVCSASISGSSLSTGTEYTIAASTSSPSSVRSFMLKVDGCLIVLMIRWFSSLGCVLWPGFYRKREVLGCLFWGFALLTLHLDCDC